MRFVREYIRKGWDNQTVIRVPQGTEAITTNELGTVRVDVTIPVTKNLDTWFFMSEEDASTYIAEDV